MEWGWRWDGVHWVGRDGGGAVASGEMWWDGMAKGATQAIGPDRFRLGMVGWESFMTRCSRTGCS